MTSYDDVLVDLDLKTEDSPKSWEFSFKAKPKENIELEHTIDSEQASESQIKFKHGEIEIEAKTGNASWGAKVKAPLDYNGFAIDQEVSFEHFAEARKPKEGYPKNEHISAFDIDFDTDITAPETHGIKYVTNVHLHTNEYGLDTLEIKKNFTLDDTDFGVKVNHQFGKDAKSTFDFQLLHKLGHHGLWFLATPWEKQATLGWTNLKSKSCQYSLSASFQQGNKGLFGLPAAVAIGGKNKLSEDANVSYILQAGEHAEAVAKFEYQLDNHWTVSSRQQFKSADLAKKPYHLGFDVEYTL